MRTSSQDFLRQKISSAIALSFVLSLSVWLAIEMLRIADDTVQAASNSPIVDFSRRHGAGELRK